MLNCGSMTFMLRPGRMYPPHDSHESVRYWNAGWFYEKNVSLATLAEENLRTILRVPVSGDTAEDVPEDEEEEEEQAPRKAAPRPSKRPRAKASGSAGASGEASAKKPKIVKPPPLDSRKAERERLKMLSTAGKRSRPIIPGAPTPTTAATRTTSQEPITKYMKKSPCWSYNSSSAKLPHCSTAISSSGGTISPSCRKHSTGNNSDPADLTSTPKAYATKFFNKLTEAEKWELEQDLLNAMLNNAWGKPDAATSEIQEFKKGVGEFFDKLVCKQKEQQALHYELHKNIALQRRVTLGQAENIRTLKDKNAELNKQLADAQGWRIFLPGYDLLRTGEPALLIPRVGDEAEGGGATEGAGRKQLAEKNSELIREKGEFLIKRNADRETIKRQQKELNGLRKYMETAEHHWDLLAENILEPLGYSERRRNKFPRDDVLSLAGDDCKDLISASRKICHNLSLKKSRTCGLRKLVKRMDILPELMSERCLMQ
ncbi:hypothetical protein QYE76_064676 [Lolium multiflorum]|uniref:Uncharacterized protein n=1 Tax=Lolium multiflorum TaxID=4521 RepID=A0AAD8S8M5_LOLMU|nr:hypothetical protein QYE76_064676 [Lolium multiflorum]